MLSLLREFLPSIETMNFGLEIFFFWEEKFLNSIFNTKEKDFIVLGMGIISSVLLTLDTARKVVFIDNDKIAYKFKIQLENTY